MKDSLAEYLVGDGAYQKDSLSSYIAGCAVVRDEAPPDGGLQKHDKRFHDGHYDGGECKYREDRGIETTPEKKTGAEGAKMPTAAEMAKVREEDTLKADTISPESIRAQWEEEGATRDVLEKAERLLDGITDGSRPPENLPTEVFQNEDVQKLPKWMLMAYVASAGLDGNDDDETIRDMVLDFAKANGAFEWDLEDYVLDNSGDFINDGMESYVYDYPEKDEKGRSQVLKHMEEPYICASNSQQILERFILGNLLFPETGYKIPKVTKNNHGKLGFALLQPKLELSGNPVNYKDLKNWAQKRGWEKDTDWESGDFTWLSPSDNLMSVDMHSENVVCDVDGRIYNLDPGVKLRKWYNRKKPPASLKEFFFGENG